MASQSHHITEAEELPVTHFVAAPGVTFTPEQCIFKPCNFVALTDIRADRDYLKDGTRFIANCPLKYAFLHVPVGITFHLQQFWHTVHCTTVTTAKGNKLDAVEFTTTLGTVAVIVGVVRAALHLLERERCSEAPPSSKEIEAFLDSTHYDLPVDKDTKEHVKAITKVEKKRFPARWQYIWTHVIQCLCSKFGSQDQAAKPHQEMAVALCIG